jgi:transcriptional regulator with XRE-family HTH domain
LVQFPSHDNNCRRCHVSYDYEEPAPPPAPAPEPVPVPARAKPPLAVTIKSLRLSLGLSQRGLASRLGVPRTYISKCEISSVTPTLSNLERIARGLETDIPTLLSGGERSRQQQVDDLLKDQFIAELAQCLPRLTEPQRRAITVQIHNMTLRRTAPY